MAQSCGSERAPFWGFRKPTGARLGDSTTVPGRYSNRSRSAIVRRGESANGMLARFPNLYFPMTPNPDSNHRSKRAKIGVLDFVDDRLGCLLYTSPSPR